MKSFEQWMSEYGESHQNPTNQIIHKLCVPVIMFSTLGYLWLIPRPELFSFSPFMNWASIFSIGALIFYATLNIKYMLVMAVECAFMLWLIHYFEINLAMNQLYFYTILFLISWVVQIIGHKIEGKKPSFMQDLSFLLIGPLWVLKALGVK